MDTQTIQLFIAGAVGCLIGRARPSTSSLVYLGILSGVVYTLYTYG